MCSCYSLLNTNKNLKYYYPTKETIIIKESI